MLKSILFAVLCGLLVMVEEAEAKLTCWHCLNDRCQESPDEWSRPSCDGFCYAVFNSEDGKVLARQCYDETDTFAETQILRVEGATPASPSDDRTLLQFESIIRDKKYATPKMAIVICNKPNCNDMSYDEAQKTLARLSGSPPPSSDVGSGGSGSDVGSGGSGSDGGSGSSGSGSDARSGGSASSSSSSHGTLAVVFGVLALLLAVACAGLAVWAVRLNGQVRRRKFEAGTVSVN